MPIGRCCWRARARTAVRALIEAGVPFDRGARRQRWRSAARRRTRSQRIVHAGGDATGRNLIKALLEMAAATPSIRIVTDCFVVDLVDQRRPRQPA